MGLLFSSVVTSCVFYPSVLVVMESNAESRWCVWTGTSFSLRHQHHLRSSILFGLFTCVVYLFAICSIVPSFWASSITALFLHEANILTALLRWNDSPIRKLSWAD